MKLLLAGDVESVRGRFNLDTHAAQIHLDGRDAVGFLDAQLAGVAHG